MLLISLLSGCACDDDSLVRASAIRASAVFVLFPSLRSDMCYIENTTESILRLMKDTNIVARIKASWSLGNITDALILNADVGVIDRNLLKRVFEMNIEAAADSDKVKSNVMRSLGNCLRLITDDLVQSPVFNQLAYQAIEKLVHNVTTGNNVKVKWNACYAIGNFMKNSILFSDGFRNKWQDLVFPALCKIIVLSPNFKVRTNAAAAMIVLTNRTDYGPHFNNIWSSMLAALEASDNLHDFNEYNHRDNLQEQLCVALSHFIELATMDDIVAMYNLLLPSLDITKQNWRRVTNTNRLLPEKSARMLSACKRLTEAEKLADIDKPKQKAIASMLLCFGNLNE
jgi:HEAT repeat-containing protein 6